jgi:hypothetical protein
VPGALIGASGETSCAPRCSARARRHGYRPPVARRSSAQSRLRAWTATATSTCRNASTVAVDPRPASPEATVDCRGHCGRRGRVSLASRRPTPTHHDGSLWAKENGTFFLFQYRFHHLLRIVVGSICTGPGVSVCFNHFDAPPLSSSRALVSPPRGVP